MGEDEDNYGVSEDQYEEERDKPILDTARIDRYMVRLLAADVIGAGNNTLPVLMADLAAQVCRAVDEMYDAEKYVKSVHEVNAMRAKRGAKPGRCL